MKRPGEFVPPTLLPHTSIHLTMRFFGKVVYLCNLPTLARTYAKSPGHSSVICEIASTLYEKRPDMIVCSVGGGGLLAGVLVGLHKVGWKDVPVLAVETEGGCVLMQPVPHTHTHNSV
jgi:L-serine/L-threonine ammonia-lyase